MDEATLRALFLTPYAAAVDAGAMSVMASFNSWNGTRMHAHRYLLTGVLKGELGFPGFVVSDWQAVDQIASEYAVAVVTSINAGVDMVMTPYDHRPFIAALTQAVARGDVSQERIDDAVRRILTAKFMLGLFEHPYHDPALLETFGGPSHRQLARRAVRSSLVLLKNENRTPPIPRGTPLVFVAGEGADDMGIQCGGWTIEWQGRAGDITPGTTILQGLRAALSPDTELHYNRFGRFDAVLDSTGEPRLADVGVVVIGEAPYAEGLGDRGDLTLSEQDRGTLLRMRQSSRRLVVIVVSGRPLILAEELPMMDALVAAWLPGSEGAGVADVLLGDYPFTGRLPY
ncbi:MAG: glycoside hydrolase family 3 protein, partial [Anaerolineales bacterium]